jgi:probable HAF family extracellular repeat protein
MVGYAETGTRDPECAPGVSVAGTGPQVLDFEGVVWGPRQGEIRVLRPLAGDTVGMALWINDAGEAVGASGTCANTVLPPLAYGPHAVLWEADGSAIDLGNLGGKAISAGLSINNQGSVTGASTLNDQSSVFDGHAFLWTKATGKMQDLGTLPGDHSSVGLGINDGGDVVGASIDSSGNSRAYLWRNGVMSDLNALVPASSPLFLLWANSINARGEIVGYGATAGGDVHAFLASPADARDSESAAPAARAVTGPALSESGRKQLRGRFWIPMR